MKYFIQTFGCAANVADSERMAAMLESRGMAKASSIDGADQVVINTCMVRRSAEDRAYGLIRNLGKSKSRGRKLKIVVTGCLVGAAAREKSGKMLKALKVKWSQVDEWLPIDEVGFDNLPLRSNKIHALVPISNGCNNYCTFCVVPFTRGREVSRPFEEIVNECRDLVARGYKEITLVGQNVNSYGADLVQKKGRVTIAGSTVVPVMVKHLGKERIPTLFPYLLDSIANISGLKRLDFISSNPWDFTNDLIDVIAKHKNISREIHLPVQSGSNQILRKMNRWYNRDEYLKLVANLKFKIRNLKLSTDIIVGFPGETEKDFQSSVEVAKKVGFDKAYVAMYSPRPLTTSAKNFPDDIPHREKRRRWLILENLINKPHLKK
jgi:tRNA-2-methylthio-N6-dimethylallyladenosine synthase